MEWYGTGNPLSVGSGMAMTELYLDGGLGDPWNEMVRVTLQAWILGWQRRKADGNGDARRARHQMGAACGKMVRKKNKSLSDEALQIFQFTKISDSVESCLLQGVFDWEAAQRAESRVR